MIKVISKKKNKVVTRRNDLIEARFRLTLQEQRLMYWVISCIEPDDDDLKTYRVSIQELAQVIDTKNKDTYGRLKKITKKVMSRIIELKKDDREILIPLINKAIYHKGKGTIDIRLDEDLKDYLLQLKDNFTSVKVNELFSLSSTYAMRIYELLMQYKRIGERTIALSELRNMLNIKPEQYQRFQHFDTRVLKKAQSEINNKTKLQFTYEKIKRNRSIHSIRFILLKNKQPKTSQKKSNDDSVLIEKLKHYGVSIAKANELMEFDSAKITEALIYVKNKGDKVENPAGLLIDFIENNWNDSGKTFLENKKKVQQSQFKNEQEKILSDQKASNALKAYNRYVTIEIRQLVEQWNSKTEAKNWDLLKDQKWRSKTSSVFPKQGIEKWTTFLNRDIVIDYLKTNNDFKLLTQTQFEVKK